MLNWPVINMHPTYSLLLLCNTPSSFYSTGYPKCGRRYLNRVQQGYARARAHVIGGRTTKHRNTLKGISTIRRFAVETEDSHSGGEPRIDRHFDTCTHAYMPSIVKQLSTFFVCYTYIYCNP